MGTAAVNMFKITNALKAFVGFGFPVGLGYLFAFSFSFARDVSKCQQKLTATVLHRSLVSLALSLHVCWRLPYCDL